MPEHDQFPGTIPAPGAHTIVNGRTEPTPEQQKEFFNRLIDCEETRDRALEDERAQRNGRGGRRRSDRPIT